MYLSNSPLTPKDDPEPEYHPEPVANQEPEYHFNLEYFDESIYNLKPMYHFEPVYQSELVYHLESVDHPNPERPLVPIHTHKLPEVYHLKLAYNPKSTFQPNQLCPTLELNLEPIYLPAPKHLIAPKIDSEPKYHLGPEYPYKIIYDQGPFHSVSLNIVYPEGMASIPSEPERPIGSDHLSVNGNCENFQLLS